jgi:two-component system cell cycle response regulator DivK
MVKILYVEDNDNNIYMLSRRLRRRGYEVVVARDGMQGVAMAKSEQPSLIIMDLVLPDIDGWEATRRLRSESVTRKIPVIALSASVTSEDKNRSIAAGCDEFDTKPVEFDRLLQKIDSLLRLNQ